MNKQISDQLNIVSEQIIKSKSDRKHNKAEYEKKRSEINDKVVKLKKTHALLLYIIKHYEELRLQESLANSGKNTEEENGLSKYIKKYENVKLFIENPVSLIQMAYKNNHPSEQEVKL